MDFDAIAKELVRAVRGERSQTILSRRLGFRGNQLRRWESGERKISWPDFVRLCETCQTPLFEATEKVLCFKDANLDGNHLVRRLIGGASQTKVSQATGISRYTILRWLNDRSVPSLADVLAVIHVCQFYLLEYIAYFVDIGSVPSAFAEYQTRRKRKEVYYKHPIAPAVLCCLKLDEYKQLPEHPEGYVAEKLHISLEDERVVLAELEKVGKIVRRGGHYDVTEEQLELTDSREIRVWVGYWLDRASSIVREVENPFPLVGCGFEMFPTNAKTAARVREEYLAFYQKVRAILAADTGPRDSVTVFNSCLLDLSLKPERPGDAVLREPKRQTRGRLAGATRSPDEATS